MINQQYIFTFASITITSLVSLIGIITLVLKNKVLQRINTFIISFAAGALISDAFVHLIPESFENTVSIIISSLSVIWGILFFFVLETIICWRHCHHETNKEHKHPLIIMNIIGDAIHNFVDGFVIASSFIVSTTLGMSTTIAVILHEIPQEIGDFGVLTYAGLKSKKALIINILTSLSSFVGALIAFALPIENLSYVLGFTAGGFLYIAIADIIPDLHKANSKLRSIGNLVGIILGIATISLLLLVE